MADKNIKEGDEVSWQWSGGRPGGKAAKVKGEGEIAIKSKRGNTIKKNASPDNPAVHISRPGNDVVKRATELDKDADGGEGEGDEAGEEKSNGVKSASPAEEKKAGEKRGQSAVDGEGEGEKKDAGKSRKTDKKETANGGAEKKTTAGRPKKGDAAPKKKASSRQAASSDGPGSRTRSKGK
ncbi:MAG: hypothetical protein M4579_002103 [Chaenotheca gracillima]|nr:MAG: hypothetical protein M4579_002103 [Chaenotheca gracillima]